jgi:hypothetical protein
VLSNLAYLTLCRSIQLLALLAASAACCPDPVGRALRPARDAVALASAAGRRRVDLPAPPDRPATAGSGGAAADRPPGQGAPLLGLPTDQRGAPTAWRTRLRDRDSHNDAPPQAGSSATADGHHLTEVLRQQAAGIVGVRLLHRRDGLAATAVCAVLHPGAVALRRPGRVKARSLPGFRSPWPAHRTRRAAVE